MSTAVAWGTSSRPQTKPAVKESAPDVEITPHDLCDRCGFRAYAAVVIAVPCPECDGLGVLKDPLKPDWEGTCPFCEGLGVKDFLPLFFCGHHFTEHESRLREVSISVTDERERLVEEVKDDGHING